MQNSPDSIRPFFRHSLWALWQSENLFGDGVAVDLVDPKHGLSVAIVSIMDSLQWQAHHGSLNGGAY